MWTVNSLIVILVFSGSCLAENNGGCEIDEISATEWQTTKRLAIDDTQINTQVFVSAYSGSLALKQLLNNGNPYVVGDISSYFNFGYNTTHIYLETTDEFANLDLQTFTNGTVSLSVGLTVTLTCSSGDSNVILRLSITDINSNSPVFSSQDYSYNVPTPIMPLTDFSVYGDIIKSTDIDFSNTAVTYTIEPDDFQVSSTVVNNKTYVASFQARNTLVLTETKEYTLTATDNGNPELSSSAKITLLVDTSQSLDIPSFSESYYTFIYTGDDTKPVLNLTNGPITAITQKNDTQITNIVLAGDYQEYFNVNLSDLTFTLSVSNLLSTVGPSVLLTLSYTTDATATCVLIINTNTDDTNDSSTLFFSSSYYTGTYNITTNMVDLENDISINSSTTVAVSISGDYSEYFSISDEYLISVNDLPSTVLETESGIVLTLTAESNDQTSSAILIVNLPRTTSNTTSIAFNSALYSGEYTVDDGKGKLNLHDEIKIETNVEGQIDVSISNADGYETYFSASYDGNIISVLPNGIFPETVLRDVSVVPLKITATLKSTLTSAVTILNILISYEDTPYFSSSYYTGTYNIATNKVDLDNNLNITSSTTVAVSISGDYSKYFSISDEYLISVNDLPSTVLETESSIVLTLTAESNNQTSSAILIVNLPRITSNTTSIAFSSALYSGEYTVDDGKGKLDIRDQIKIDTNVEDEEIDVSISSADGYEKYFSISHAAKIISVLPNGIIPDTVLQEVSVVSLKITATVKSTTISAFAVLNILINYDEDDDSSTDTDGVVVSGDSHIAYIVSIVVLAVLLVGIIILTILLWYFKIRNRNYENMEEDEYRAKPSFSKNSVKTTDKNSSNSIEKRRPTGFIFKPLGEDVDEDAIQDSGENPHDRYSEEPENKPRERKKSVVFDDNVETMQIDKVDDDDSDIESIENDGRQNNLNSYDHVDEVRKYVDDGDNINENHKDVCSENGEQKHL